MPPALPRPNGISSARSGFPSSKRIHFESTAQSTRASGNVLRRAAPAGTTSTISPREPSRTSRNRWSVIAAPADMRKKIARRMPLGIADDGHTNSEHSRELAFRHSLRCVVGALGVNVGLQLARERLHVELVEYDHVIHGCKRRHERRPRSFREDRAPLAL